MSEKDHTPRDGLFPALSGTHLTNGEKNQVLETVEDFSNGLNQRANVAGVEKVEDDQIHVLVEVEHISIRDGTVDLVMSLDDGYPSDITAVDHHYGKEYRFHILKTEDYPLTEVKDDG